MTSTTSDWWDSVATLEESWARLSGEAAKLRKTCRDTAAAEAMDEAVAATSQVWKATLRVQLAEVALGLLLCLVATCDKATMFPLELRQLGEIKAAPKGTGEVSPISLWPLYGPGG